MSDEQRIVQLSRLDPGLTVRISSELFFDLSSWSPDSVVIDSALLDLANDHSTSCQKMFKSAGDSRSGELDNVGADDARVFKHWAFVVEMEHFRVECDGWVNVAEPPRVNCIRDNADQAALFC